MFNITSAAIIGIDAVPVTVETDISFGLSAFNIVGLPDTTVKESRERIRAAIKQASLPFPRTRITINLAPADIKKLGPLYDLPIAASILLAQGEFSREAIAHSVMIGEVSLDGQVRPVHGVLTVALMAKTKGFSTLFVPSENAAEATCVPGIQVIPVPTLRALIDHLKGTQQIKAATASVPARSAALFSVDMQDIRGQEQAKRGLEIAAAGGHNILLQGPPGTGKTMLAKALPSILPALSTDEAIEVTSISSIAGILPANRGLLDERPFRSPHHSASAVSLIGGGSWPRPGEVSLAHRGVLFLDEFPEFSRHVLEHLRQPLEDGEIHIARAAMSVRFPARFLLIASMNPCPCGYTNDRERACVCTPQTVNAYQRRLSGPLMDRFDLIIDVPNIQAQKLLSDQRGEASEQVRTRVKGARGRQHARFEGSGYQANADIPPSKLDTWCGLDAAGKQLLERAASHHHVSARGISRIRKVARTIADLDGSETIQPAHLAEALHYRLPEQKDGRS